MWSAKIFVVNSSLLKIVLLNIFFQFLIQCSTLVLIFQFIQIRANKTYLKRMYMLLYFLTYSEIKPKTFTQRWRKLIHSTLIQNWCASHYYYCCRNTFGVSYIFVNCRGKISFLIEKEVPYNLVLLSFFNINMSTTEY